MLQGPASGSGSCRSAESGTWDLQYTGSWAEGYSSNAWCPGDYDVHLTVTNRSTGRTLHQEQLWFPKEQNGEEVFYVESSYNGLPVGAGTITESPDACSYPMSMSTATNWVFVIPG